MTIRTVRPTYLLGKYDRWRGLRSHRVAQGHPLAASPVGAITSLDQRLLWHRNCSGDDVAPRKQIEPRSRSKMCLEHRAGFLDPLDPVHPRGQFPHTWTTTVGRVGEKGDIIPPKWKGPNSHSWGHARAFQPCEKPWNQMNI